MNPSTNTSRFSFVLPPSRLKRWLAAISAVLLTTLGAGAVAPAAQAAPSEVTATVFDTPEVRHVNVRNGAGTEYAKIDQISAGASVTLECYSYGSQVQGPLVQLPCRRYSGFSLVHLGKLEPDDLQHTRCPANKRRDSSSQGTGHEEQHCQMSDSCRYLQKSTASPSRNEGDA